MYVALVMTESVSYLTYSIALWAVVLALERPTTLRQLGVLGAVALAYATRAQFAVLFAAYVLALAIVWAVLPGRRPGSASSRGGSGRRSERSGPRRSRSSHAPP